ncbi:MAG TPA: CHAD domain-containing protein [Terriglobia bacterium]|nr:CHAD domain-containing protein [Terriglobia bacterium]
MAHLNGHATSNAFPDAPPSVFLPKAPVEEDGAQSAQAQDRDARRKAPGGEDNGARPGEWAQVFELARKHLDRCVALEPKVLHGDDPDAIHDLRVATRRLQQVIDLIHPSPHSGDIRKLYRGLKRCRSSLSEIRNYDVLLAKVDAALGRKRTARREAWEAIGEYLRGLRSVRMEKSLRKLAKANLSSIYVRLKEFLPSNGTSGDVPGNSSGNGAERHLEAEQFYERVADALKTVWAELEQQIARSRHERDASVLHHTRVAAKRARYLIEAVQACEAPGSREVLIWLRSLQSQLGHWHDRVVFEEYVLGMLADRDFLRDHLEMAIQIERLMMANRAAKSKLEKKYVELVRDRTGFLKAREWVRQMVDSPATLFAGS